MVQDSGTETHFLISLSLKEKGHQLSIADQQLQVTALGMRGHTKLSRPTVPHTKLFLGSGGETLDTRLRENGHLSGLDTVGN